MRGLIVLGTVSQVPTRTRNRNGYLLRWDGEGLLFDPGEGTLRQMIHAGVSATRICLTHVHGDHCFGLPGVLSRMALDGVAHPVHLHCPSSGEEVVRALVAVSTPGIDLRLHPHGGRNWPTALTFWSRSPPSVTTTPISPGSTVTSPPGRRGSWRPALPSAP